MDDGSERKSAVADSFGESAEGYRSSETHREGRDLERLASWCAEATRVLDIATGAGHAAGALVDAGVPNVVAVDAAPRMIGLTLESFPGVEGVIGDAERLPFETGTFDAVTCRIAAHHFPDPEAFVAEVGRVLRPGGVFALEDNVAPEDDALASFLNRLDGLRDPTHVEAYSTSTWHGWLEDAGFSLEATEHLVKRLDFGPWVERIRSLDDEDRERVRRFLVDAPDDAVECFDVRYEDGEPHSFGSQKVLIRARRGR